LRTQCLSGWREAERPALSNSSPALAVGQQPAELIANAANPSYQLMKIQTAGETRFQPMTRISLKMLEIHDLEFRDKNFF